MTSEAKHTKGPWIHSDRSHNGGDIICPAEHANRPLGGYVDANRCRDEYIHRCWFSKEESAANAHLIAAAPEMFEALQGFVNATINDDPDTIHNLCTLRDQASLALAKAQGR